MTALYEFLIEMQKQLTKFAFMPEKADYASLKLAEKTMSADYDMNDEVKI